MLLTEADWAGVEIQLKTHIDQINPKDKRFCLTTNIGEIVAESVVIATGGLSIPTMGASPYGYQIGEQFGHTILSTRAGLVPFTLQKKDLDKLSELSGISVDAEVSIGLTHL